MTDTKATDLPDAPEYIYILEPHNKRDEHYMNGLMGGASPLEGSIRYRRDDCASPSTVIPQDKGDAVRILYAAVSAIKITYKDDHMLVNTCERAQRHAMASLKSTPPPEAQNGGADETVQCDRFCNFCGAKDGQVKYVIPGPTATICDKCVGVCNDYLADSDKTAAPVKSFNQIIADKKPCEKDELIADYCGRGLGCECVKSTPDDKSSGTAEHPAVIKEAMDFVEYHRDAISAWLETAPHDEARYYKEEDLRKYKNILAALKRQVG